MFLRIEAKQHRAKQRSTFKVERARGLFHADTFGLSLTFAKRQVGEVHYRQANVTGRLDATDGHTSHIRKGRPQNVVAPDEFGKPPFESLHIKHSLRRTPGRDCIGRAARIEPVKKPESLLSQ